MSGHSDADLLRYDDDADRDDFGRLDPATAPVGQVVLARTKTVATYPSAAGQYVACTTLALLGAEAEGSPGAATAAGDTFYALIPAGAPVPSSGDQVVAACVPYRWVLAL